MLDIKLRLYSRYVGKLPWRERIVSLLHGLYYLQGLCAAIALAVFLVILAGGSSVQFLLAPTVAATLPIVLVFLVADLFRQRFYLDWRREWGLH